MKRSFIIICICMCLSSGLILPDQKIRWSNQIPILNPQMKKQLDEISQLILKNKQLDMVTQTKWVQIIKENQLLRKPEDITGLIYYVMAESMKEIEENAKYYKSRLRFYNDLSKELHDYLNDLKNAANQEKLKSRARKSPSLFMVKVKDFSPALIYARKVLKKGDYSRSNLLKPGSLRIQFTEKNIQLNSAQCDKMIKKYEEELAEIGDDGRLANIELQNVLEKQQYILQLMKNVQKTLQDLAMGVIRKLG